MLQLHSPATEADLRPLLESLETDPPERFPLTLDEWAELLALVDPGEYLDPPPANDPALALSTDARVAVYAERECAGTGLWHAGDSWRGGRLDALGIAAHRRLNGTTVEDGVVARKAA